MKIFSRTYLLSYGCEFSIPGMTGIVITYAMGGENPNPDKYYICGEIWMDSIHELELHEENDIPLDLSIKCKLNSNILKDCELSGIKICGKPGEHFRSYTYVAKGLFQTKEQIND